MSKMKRTNSILDKVLLRTSIRSRLIVYFMLSVLIPTSLLAVTSFTKSSEIVTSKMDQLIKNNLNTAEAGILQKIESADDITTLVSFNNNLQQIFSSPKPVGATEIVEEINTLNVILESYYLSNLSNFTQTTFFPKIYMLNRYEYKGYNITDKVFDISEIENEEWYKEFTTGIAKVVGFDQSRTMLDTIDSIKVARKIYEILPYDAVYSAILTIDIETGYFNKILESIKSSPNSTVFILDENNSAILKTNNFHNHDVSFLESYNSREFPEVSYNSWIDEINGDEMLMSVKKINKLSWKIVSVSPIKELNKELRSFNKSTYLVIAICALLALLLALLLSNDLSKPIRKLVKSMSEVKEGNFDINISYKRDDEFAFLIFQYEKMMKEIQELIDKLYVAELEKNKVELRAKEYELKALQAQINPHFLYNTLDSVNWLALKYNAEDISTMVKSLSNFFRYSLSKGKNEITLETEKLQIESYLKIQSIRFKEKLSYSINFSPDVLKCKTVKLILQPIVENAIIHGLETRKTGGFIDITCRRVMEDIEIKISDNGIGADIDELNDLLSGKIESDSSFGIKNVNERIKQFFGDKYGLTFYTNEPTGVVVMIIIPYQQL